MLEKGLVQIYTGNGKGKTTAALGLALRAAGAGNQILFFQFLKPPTLDLGERKAAEAIDNITINALQQPWDMSRSFDDAEAVSKTRSEIAKTCCEIAKAVKNKLYDVIILDEIVFCLNKDLASLDDVQNIIDQRDSRVEIVLTGRGADDDLINLADLATEMKLIKHPFEKGIKARKGIEF